MSFALMSNTLQLNDLIRLRDTFRLASEREARHNGVEMPEQDQRIIKWLNDAIRQVDEVAEKMASDEESS